MSNRIIEAFEEKKKMLVSGLESTENIRNLIYEVRGKQVMLDSDLALLYNCANKTKDINKAVNRNIDRFPKDFYFQLTLEEYSNLKFQNGTSSLDNNYGGVRKLPYVFTEGGVSMLASVLRTEVASKMSVAIIRAFISMKHYIGFNASRITNIETKVIEHDTQIKTLKETLDKFEEKKKVTETYFDGKIFDAYSKIYEIFSEAKKKLIIIDNYADIGLLDIIKRLNIKVVIVTKENNLLTKKDIENYNKQYHNLKVIYNSSFHDRYFILDDKIVYHCGASLNRIGYKTFSITLVNDNFLLESLLEKAKFV